MKNSLILLIILFASCSPNDEKGPFPVIPEPVSAVRSPGAYKLRAETGIFIPDSAMTGLLEIFADQIKDYTNLKMTGRESASIEIMISPGMPDEGYSLRIGRKRITIKAESPHGVFNGFQTLRQLIAFSGSGNGSISIHSCTIDDEPRFAWRGLMLDESRHFFGTVKVKQLLDMMALHKLNTFHWHLTDVPGWRIEIKKYPKLTTIGATGNHSDSNAPPAFYTQEELTEIVNYARERFIRVIPEIDMPGHAAASNRAYPEFSGGGSEAYPNFTFNPGKEGTYSFLTDILKEVSALFPSEYIHLGGDEVHFGNQQWNKDPLIRKLMKEKNLPDLKSVEKYFVRRMSDSINSLGKTTIGWDEITDLNLDRDNAVIMWWRHDRPGQLSLALEEGYKVVLCPRIPLYFDFVQAENHKVGRKWKGAFADLEKVYQFPPDTIPGITDRENQILGLQANIWTEQIGDDKRLDFMTYPRLSALAEAGWTSGRNKDYKRFLVRLLNLTGLYKDMGIYYFDPFNPENTPEPVGPVLKK